MSEKLRQFSFPKEFRIKTPVPPVFSAQETEELLELVSNTSAQASAMNEQSIVGMCKELWRLGRWLKFETHEPIGILPQDIKLADSLKDKILYDASRRYLIFRGVMSKTERDRLLRLSPNDPYKNAVNALFQKSQSWKEEYVRNPEARNKIGKFLERTERVLKGAGITICDYTGKKYDPGLVMKVLGFQPYEGLTEQVILETVEPTIYHNNTIINVGQIIVGIIDEERGNANAENV